MRRGPACAWVGKPFGICLSATRSLGLQRRHVRVSAAALGTKPGLTAGLSSPRMAPEGIRGRRRRQAEIPGSIAHHPDAGRFSRRAGDRCRGQDQDRLGRASGRRYQHRRRQSQHGGRGREVRLCLQRHERHHLGHRRPAARNRGSGRAARAGLETLRGVLPFDALSPDEQSLYVACRFERGCRSTGAVEPAGYIPPAGSARWCTSARMAMFVTVPRSQLGTQRCWTSCPRPALASGRHHGDCSR